MKSQILGPEQLLVNFAPCFFLSLHYMNLLYHNLLGFMGVELDVDGQLDVHASFGLELYEDSSAEGPVALRYKLTPEFTVGNVEGNPNNALSFDIKVDGLGLSENPTMVGSGTVSLSYDLENGFETATSYSMGEGFESLLTYFSSFSIEKLYTALDSLAKRIAESVDGSNQKIPVIVFHQDQSLPPVGQLHDGVQDFGLHADLFVYLRID